MPISLVMEAPYSSTIKMILASGPVYMILPRRDGTFLSRLDGKLAKAGWRVYMDKYIAGMKPF